MKKILFQITIIFLALEICSCKPTIKKIEAPVIPISNFVLSQNERKLLCFDSCTNEINIDTAKSVINFRNSERKFYSNRKSKDDEFCVLFNFITTDTIPALRLKVQYKVPYTYSSGGGISLSNYYFLFAQVLDNDKIDIVSLNGGYNLNAKDFNTYITKLYLKVLDSNHAKRKINIWVSNDSMHLVNTYLSQLVIGYIIAQRQICKEDFKKDINEATMNELGALRRKNPFVFGLKNKDSLNPKLVTTQHLTPN